MIRKLNQKNSNPSDSGKKILDMRGGKIQLKSKHKSPNQGSFEYEGDFGKGLTLDIEKERRQIRQMEGSESFKIRRISLEESEANTKEEQNPFVQRYNDYFGDKQAPEEEGKQTAAEKKIDQFKFEGLLFIF